MQKKQFRCAAPANAVKIGFVSPYDWSYHGGVRSHILDLAAELERMGHSTTILTSATGKAGRTAEPHIYKLGWAVPIPWNGSIARVACSPLLARQTREVLENEQFDVVHLHEPLAPALPLTTLHVLKGLKTVSVGTFHAFAPNTLSMPRVSYSLGRRPLRRYFNRLTGRIAVSSAAHQFASRYFAGDYQIIPNGVDLHRFSTQAQPLPQFADDKLNILYLGRRPLRRYFNRLTGRIAVSSAAHQFASRYFAGDYQIIPNGVDLHRFSTHAQPLPQFADGKLNILYLGRIEPRKGLKYLLHAIPQIRASYPNTRFIIASDGPQREHYEQFVQQQGWPDVVFTGFIPSEEKPRYYASCDLFCAPSTGSESQGVVLLEAMASCKPVVASNIDGYRDVIGDGVEGILVPPRDSVAVAGAICTLLGDANLRATMGERGRERAAAFSWPQIASRITEYYESLIEQQTYSTNQQHQRLFAFL